MYPPLVAPPVLELAARLGLTVGRRGFGPCPVCGAVRRGSGESRGPVSVFSARNGSGERWACKAGGCEAGGDALALLAYARHREPPPAGDPRWRGLYAELRGDRDEGPAPRVVRPSPSPPPPLAAGPDRREVAALWAACSPLDTLADTDPAIRWLRGYRDLSVEVIAALDLARAMPTSGTLPKWASPLGIDRSTWRTVYRLAVPVYDARGELAALRFRAIDRYPLGAPPPGCRFEDRNGKRVLLAPLWTPDGEEPRGDRSLPKALAAAGVGSAAGLVLADPMGLALLNGRTADGEVLWDRRVFIVEGETDMWRVSAPRTPRVKDGATYATFGVESGSWTAEHARRIPDNTTVLILTDPDPKGDEYAAAIGRTLTGRCMLKRPKRSKDADKE